MLLPKHRRQPGGIPALRALPMKLSRRDENVVIFESWHGTYSDNPRAISEALHASGSPLTQVWVLDERPPTVITVEPESLRYLEYLGRAGHVVSNTHMPGYYRKKPGVQYIQTWHG